MPLKYWGKQRLTQFCWQQELASMGVSAGAAIAVIAQVRGEIGGAAVSVTCLLDFLGKRYGRAK